MKEQKIAQNEKDQLQLSQAIWTQSLILYKMLAFTGTINLSRFRGNWDVSVTNKFFRF